MKTTLYLIRHGETEWNLLGKFQGRQDISLSNAGVEQAKYLARRMSRKFDCLYVSPLKRALKTAQIICEGSEFVPQIDDRLREINFGDWEGLTVKEIKEKFPKEFETWVEDELEGPICGGDFSIKNASIRATEAIISHVKEHKGQKIAIVAHGGIIKAGLIGLFNWNMNMYHNIVLGNTSICEISFNEFMKPIIITLNDTSHLPEEYKAKSYV